MKNYIPLEIGNGYEVRYHIKKRFARVKSKYQMIDIIDNRAFGRMMFLDGDLQISESDGIYDQLMTMALYPVVGKSSTKGPGVHPDMKKVLILGGGDGGVLKETLSLLDTNSRVVLVDIDKDVVGFSKKYLKKICDNAFSDSRALIVYKDAMSYLEDRAEIIKDWKGWKRFDAIIYDLTMHPEKILNVKQRPFLDKMFRLIHANLKRGGTFKMQVASEYDKKTQKLVEELLKRYFVKVSLRPAYIPSFCEMWVFGSCKRAS